MLFMSIWVWKSENRDEVKKRWSEYKYPEGIKLVGEWLDLTGNRIFVLYEADDPRIVLEANDLWLDIAVVDTVPVMEAKEVAKIMAEKMERSLCKDHLPKELRAKHPSGNPEPAVINIINAPEVPE